MRNYDSGNSKHYSLTKENMKARLEYEHNEELKKINSIHEEQMREKDLKEMEIQNSHEYKMGELDRKIKQDQLTNIENMKKISNEGKDNEMKRDNEKKVIENQHTEKISYFGSAYFS